MQSLRAQIKPHLALTLVNILLFNLVSISYFDYLPEGLNAFEWGYIAIATLGQMGLLAALVGLVSLPFSLIKSTVLRMLSTAAIFTAALVILYCDTQVFAQYRFHIQPVLIEMVLSGGIVEFSLANYLFAVMLVLLIFTLQLAAYWLILSRELTGLKTLGKYVSSVILLCMIATHVTHIWASANAVNSITNFSRFLPLFYPATANRLMLKYGLVNEAELAQQNRLKIDTSTNLAYPLSPVNYQPVTPPNILFIVIDSWRHDSFSAEITPNIWQYAQAGQIFKQHYSVGNATRAGIFGLFYGLPATYWQSFYRNHQSPLLMDRMLQLDYQMGIFSSAHLLKPEFDETVFVDVPNLRVRSKGETKPSRDIEITQEWLAWNKHKDPTRPAFSFLFYDSPHGYDFPEDYPHKFELQVPRMDYLSLSNDTDRLPILNRYNTSVHFNDSLIGKVLNQLKESGELANTLVVITGDHGQEINDNKLNFWGHNGNFTDAQIKVPFMMFGADLAPSVNQYFTDHMDLVPTLMQNYLGATGPVENYSAGYNLFKHDIDKRKWLILASYSDFALVNEDSILHVSAIQGGYQYMDRHNRPKEGKPDFKQVNQAYELMRRYLK
ncbi:choline-sulfatase [Shewanella sairae]|uniref:Choline-sulfatase n=1 Tax=Shewanella sairae TaxID=190310 RepID=A0ABQ4P7V9_9GAMM|nr:DUF3413 domain-containing protein [Shewanella sairae]MCL1130436.1 DUF3413 domain-containing protein [Shewanella sairae]GIU43546.1 choline-sulfatase [Shewanella sairae]